MNGLIECETKGCVNQLITNISVATSMTDARKYMYFHELIDLGIHD